MEYDTVNVRYMVDDVEAAIAWYTQHLGFELLSITPLRLPMCPAAGCGFSLADRQARRDGPCPTERSRRQAAGIAFASLSTIFLERSLDCGGLASGSETIS